MSRGQRQLQPCSRGPPGGAKFPQDNEATGEPPKFKAHHENKSPTSRGLQGAVPGKGVREEGSLAPMRVSNNTCQAMYERVTLITVNYGPSLVRGDASILNQVHSFGYYRDWACNFKILCRNLEYLEDLYDMRVTRKFM